MLWCGRVYDIWYTMVVCASPCVSGLAWAGPGSSGSPGTGWSCRRWGDGGVGGGGRGDGGGGGGGGGRAHQSPGVLT